MKRISWLSLSSVFVFLAFFAFQLTARIDQQPSDKFEANIQKLMQSMKKSENIEALIYLKDQASFDPALLPTSFTERVAAVTNTLRQQASDTQQNLIAYFEENNISYKPFFIVNMIQVNNINRQQLEEIAELEEVGRISANPTVTGLKYFRDQDSLAKDQQDVLAIEAGIKNIQADKVWQMGNKGEGIVIAGQDTGVNFNHPSLKNQYRGHSSDGVDHNYNWYDAIDTPIGSSGNNPCGYSATAPCDDNDHGTHTVGTIVGDDGANNQIGVAPAAKWIACRNMDAGNGKPSSYIDCYQFFLAPFAIGADRMKDGDPSRAPHIINNSWGCPPSEGCNGTEFIEVLANIKAAGIFNVVSAGNDGFAGCKTIKDAPAHHSDTSFTVGASNASNDSIASFSSRGPSAFDGMVGPNVSAPGVSVRSALRNGGYGSFSGTSMAGPHVVGAVALLWSAKPDYIGNYQATQDLLQSTARARTSIQTCGGVSGSSIPNNTFGHGIINIHAAITSALN